MRIEDIISSCDVVSTQGDLGTEIRAITDDSRKVAEGSLFVAVRGYASDGH